MAHSTLLQIVWNVNPEIGTFGASLCAGTAFCLRLDCAVQAIFFTGFLKKKVFRKTITSVC